VKAARRAPFWSFRILCAGALGVALLAACTSADAPETVVGGALGSYVVPSGIHKIKHVIIIMQENRSFDSYFGTYPGAVGIPMHDGVPTVCVPSPAGGCDRPYHDTSDINGGGPHGETASVADVNHGKMNGFIHQQVKAKSRCRVPDDPACTGTTGTSDVMGYHTAAEIPNYWAYAKNFVLQDHLFEAVKSWSLPEHLFLVSGWSAKCTNRSPMSCVNNIAGPYNVSQMGKAVNEELTTGQTSINMAWTDITWLLHAHHVSWAYYVQAGSQPDCTNDQAETCTTVRQNFGTPGIWNPLPLFVDVHQDLLPPCRRHGHPARGELDHPVGPGQRAPAGQRPPGPGVRHGADQRRHEEPGLEVHGDLPELGRLGRLLRRRGPPGHRRERLRHPGPRHRHLALRQEGLHRPADAQQ